METMRVAYHLAVDPARGEARAEALAREQTVEVPRSVVRDAFVEERILGRVASVEPAPDGGCVAAIDYPVGATACDPAQLLNVVFGNTSLHADARCLDVEPPASILTAFHGPRFGIAGLRKAVGVYDRPLTCTAIKPMGLSPAALADLCRTFARAGIDVVKDDHGLADAPYCPFEERVRACLAAVEEAAEETGRRALYAPNLIGSPETVLRQLRFAEACGAGAVLVSPMLVGLPFFWELCQRHASVPVLAHPAFGGAQRFEPGALFGRLFRLFGADAVIFVSYGSRFAASREACRALADRLVRPWGPVVPSLPVPAGGIGVDGAADVVSFYGRDAMLLVGGDLQVEPGAVFERSRRFVEAVQRA